MPVPYTFGTATAAIPLSQLDSNFATAITLGNTAVYLGNTTTSIGNLTLTNVTISSGEVTTGNASVSGNVTLTGGTANGVAYLNTSKVLTTGSALVFDGTNLGVGVTPSAWSGAKALEIASSGSGICSFGATDVRVLGNAYWNGSAYKYGNTNLASMYVQNTGIHYWYNAASGTAGNTISWNQAMTLDASGNLAVGISSGYRTAASYNAFALNGTTGSLIDLYANSTRVGGIAATSGQVTVSSVTSVPLVFSTADTDRARIDSSGNLLVGKTAVDFSVAGVAVQPSGVVGITRSGGVPLIINRLASDGDLVNFQQDGTLEGSISVSGTTVSYNGGHLSRWAQTTTAKDESLVKGTVLSNLDEMNVYTDADGNPVDNEQLNKVKVSDTEGDVNVAGVFVNWSYDEQHSVDEINMAMTGDMIIRIAQGVTVARGDLLMSAGDGTAKPQGDDIVRSKTVAKVTSNHVTCTYADGSYCVPCVLMAC